MVAENPIPSRKWIRQWLQPLRLLLFPIPRVLLILPTLLVAPAIIPLPKSMYKSIWGKIFDSGFNHYLSNNLSYPLSSSLLFVVVYSSPIPPPMNSSMQMLTPEQQNILSPSAPLLMSTPPYAPVSDPSQTMQCIACRREIAKGSSFCNHCGSTQVGRCNTCGYELQLGSQFCNRCGVKQF